MSKQSMTVGQFMSRPFAARPPRSVVLMRIPGGKTTFRLIRYFFT
ncbi:hypothetical protein [Paenibacillus sp. YYML68]|nr:hypothetical protein [Paenibacillus sp. YYML68]